MDVLRIRSLTLGAAFSDLSPAGWEKISVLTGGVADFFHKHRVKVQTMRLVLPPLRPSDSYVYPRITAALDSVAAYAAKHKIRWVCLPLSAEPGWGQSDIYLWGVDLIRRYPFLFLHYLASENGAVYFSSLPDIARTVLNIAGLSGNGYDNFRVGVGANIKPNTPFFPFSLHQGRPGFSFAVESLGLVIKLFKKTKQLRYDLEDAGAYIAKALAEVCSSVNAIGLKLEESTGGAVEYKGVDISLAPFPDETHSVSALMEEAAQNIFCAGGSLSATAYFSNLLKDALKISGARAVGFNGVMYSPLEDRALAARLKANADIRLENFMLYSTVCGCGVDMIPIEGNTLPDNLATLYQDVAVLSGVHGKPLGVRVLPVPGKRVNQLTEFNHDFLVNTRIFKTEGVGLLGMQDPPDVFCLGKMHDRR